MNPLNLSTVKPWAHGSTAFSSFVKLRAHVSRSTLPRRLRNTALFRVSHRPRVADSSEVQPSKDDDLPRPIVYLDETKIADSQPLDRLPSATAI